MVTRVKICGLTRREDAELAIELGAHALGFIFEPSSKRHLSKVPEWIVDLPPYVTRVAVFGIVRAGFNDPLFDAVQGSGWKSRDSNGSSFRRIEAMPCGRVDTADAIVLGARYADAIMLDARVEGQFGGTGQVADWSLASEVVRISPKVVILAGGLTPENVGGAIRQVRPFAVDVSGGVEASPGIKDAGKMRAFFEAVRSNS